MSGSIGNYEWLFTNTNTYVTIFAKEDKEAVRKLIDFSRIQLGLNIQNASLIWDEKQQVGYVCEI